MEIPKKRASVLDVPDWRAQPSSLLWEIGKPMHSISISFSPRQYHLPPEVESMRTKLSTLRTANLHNGDLMTVDDFVCGEDDLHITASSVDFFSYLSSSYHFREQQSKNPIRPLAVQGALLFPNDRLLIERRIGMLDMPEKLSLIGGALTSDAVNPADAMQNILLRKLGIDIDPTAMQLTGFDRDNVNNIFCIFFLVRINKEDESRLLSVHRDAIASKKKIFYFVSLRDSNQFVERLIECQDIQNWNPAGFDNLLYSLAAMHLRSPQDIVNLQAKAYEKIHKGVISEYQYPIEQLLSLKR